MSLRPTAAAHIGKRNKVARHCGGKCAAVLLKPQRNLGFASHLHKHSEFVDKVILKVKIEYNHRE